MEGVFGSHGVVCMLGGAEAFPECEMMTPDHTAVQARSFW